MTFWYGLLLGVLFAGINGFLIGVICGYFIGYRIAAKDVWEAERHDEILERLDAETEWELPETEES